VVVGNLFSRLVSRCANASAKTALREYLEPHQLVVSSLGAEAQIHAFRSFHSRHIGTPMAILCLDSRNAFNEMHRQHILEQVLAVVPGMAA